MTQKKIELPVINSNNNDWILLKVIGEKFTFRAVSIKHKGRVKEDSNHRVDEAIAEGSVKVRPRAYDISKLLK